MAFDFSSDLQSSLTNCSSHYVSRLSDFITRYYDSCFFVGAKLPLVLLFYAIAYSGSMQKHAEYVTMMCRVCATYCSPTRSTTNISMFRLWTELSTVFGINTWVDSGATHPTFFCYACCRVIERYQIAMRLVKLIRHFTNLLDGWRARADQICTFCEYVSSIRKGRRPKNKIKNTSWASIC